MATEVRTAFHLALARYIAATRKGSTHEVYERDEGVLRVAREHLGLRTHPKLRVRRAPARC